MDDLLPHVPGVPLDGPEPMEHVDPLLARRIDRKPWEIRSAQWRAWTLAEAVFGTGVRVHLSGRIGYQGIRGLLTMTVPFRDLTDHRGRESLFLSWAAQDPVLSRMPLIFIFQPDAAPHPRIL
jgi:hypothetical protein